MNEFFYEYAPVTVHSVAGAILFRICYTDLFTSAFYPVRVRLPSVWFAGLPS